MKVTVYNWNKITPTECFVDKITKAPVMLLYHEKQAGLHIQTNNGKQPLKNRVKSYSSNEIEYEFTIVLDIDMTHTKSNQRTNLFT